jgi:hypothetical protein
VSWTYGIELEWPDIDVRTPLPEGWDWSRTDYTIINSNAVANDPKHKDVLIGGELNSPPCASPEELADQSGVLRDLLHPGNNYRSNTHIHVSIPGLTDDLQGVKRIASKTREFLPELIDVFDPLDGLLDAPAPRTPDELSGAIARRRHSKRSRHYFTSQTRHDMRMSAETLEKFLEYEVPTARNGRPCWALASREAVNLRSLRKHGTIEFRCFAATNNPAQIEAATSLCRDWLRACLGDGSEEDFGYVVDKYLTSLPHQLPYDHRLEMGWEYTNFQHNDRETVRQRLREMGVTA